jgi:drug/metabolite transporter (DMT)-like permease
VTGIGLALLSSSCFAASHVVSRRGLEGTSVSAGYMVIVGCAWVVVMIPMLLDPPETVSTRAVVFFALSGLFAPAIRARRPSAASACWVPRSPSRSSRDSGL